MPSCRRVPALVPLAFAPDALARYGDLSGVSVDAEIACNGGRFRENLLFTHRGLSGPAILQISSYWDGRDAAVDRPAARDGRCGVACGHATSQGAAAQRCSANACPSASRSSGARRTTRRCRCEQLGESRLREIAARLHDWRVLPSGTLGYHKAEVTCGGVDTRGLSSKTMAATEVPGLYFIGEVVDVTGWLGGYNFQWAWASGHAAGQFA